jgi:hypothetical protein
MIVCRFDIKKWHMSDGSISIQLIYKILCKTYNENMLLDDDKRNIVVPVLSQELYFYRNMSFSSTTHLSYHRFCVQWVSIGEFICWLTHFNLSFPNTKLNIERHEPL